MPKFEFLKEGTNDQLLGDVRGKVQEYLSRMLSEDELVEVDGMSAFPFGSVMVQVRVLPWHTTDVLVEVFSYLAEDVEYGSDLGEKLMRLNATMHFGAFGLTFDNSIVFTYSLAGANIDYNELLAAVQTVATVADNHDELVRELSA